MTRALRRERVNASRGRNGVIIREGPCSRRINLIDGTRRVGVQFDVFGRHFRLAHRMGDGVLDLGPGLAMDFFQVFLVEQLGGEQAFFEHLHAVGLVVAQGAARRRMAVQARHSWFEHVGRSRRSAMVHGALDGEPARDRVVAVDDFAGDAERFAAVDDAARGVLGAVRRRDAPAVVGDDHEDGQFVAGPGGPDQARGEIPLGRARVAADDDGDAVAAVAFLHEGGAGRHERTAFR